MQSSTYLPFHIPFLPSLSNYLKPDGLIQLTVQAFLDFLPLAKKIDLFSSFARMKNDHPISPTNEVLLFSPSPRVRPLVMEILWGISTRTCPSSTRVSLMATNYHPLLVPFLV